jgi:geranylgeranyl diphosphate synthase type I
MTAGIIRAEKMNDLKNAVDTEIRRIMDKKLLPDYSELHEMMAYHLGYGGGNSENNKAGKRLRPIILLLMCQAMMGSWKNALPAAAAVELLHNFTLIHDDIQDQSPLRHGRASVWKKWNSALAINAGDAMFSLSNLALLELVDQDRPDIILEAQKVVFETCIELTHGQHLDIANEEKDDLSVSQYTKMIECKTAALLGASMQLGVIVAGGNLALQRKADEIGRAIGMAFQITDDILGIWGKAEVTGKSNQSDLLSRKLSLPILYGLQQNKDFANRWRQGAFSPEEIPVLAEILENEGARKYAEESAKEYSDKALTIFESMEINRPEAFEIKVLMEGLVSRNY